jgi:quercetin dioxygenase-like cupin family protein
MRTFAAVVFLASAGAAWAPAPAAGPAHTVVTPATLQWGPGPPALPKGVMVTVLSGDPGQPGPYVLRAKLPAGYVIKPHWHPTDENLTVLSGELKAGMGDAIDETFVLTYVNPADDPRQAAPAP